MNPYAVVVLTALLAEHLLHALADWLNLRSLRPEAPEGLRDIYDAQTYARSQEYTRTRTRFGIVASTVQLAVVLLFWSQDGFGRLDEVVRGLELGPLATGLAYLGALGLGWHLVHLPFSWYSTFVIEERFGFNKTDARTFWGDQLKGLLLAAFLGGLLLSAVLWLFRGAGESAWLWCWGVVAAFLILVQFVAPAWIMPLFHRFEPLEDGELRAAILDYARSVSFPLEGIYVIDGSRRSTKANAFFTGFGSNKRIALFDTLVARHTTEELVAVVAHEIGHYRRRHILQGMVIGLAHVGLLFWLLSRFVHSEGLFEAFGVREPSVYVGLVLFGLLYTPIELALSLALNALSRRNEYQADAFAVATTGRARELSDALRKLTAENFSNLSPHPFYVALNDSHPPLRERLEAIDAAG